MAADAWSIYNSFPERMGDGGHDLDVDAFYVQLLLSTSNCLTLTLDTEAELTNELAAGDGYVAGGQALDNITWVEAAGTVTFDCDPEVFTAAGGDWTFRYQVVYNQTAGLLVAVTTIDNTPADVTLTDGNTYTMTPHASGLFTVAQV